VTHTGAALRLQRPATADTSRFVQILGLGGCSHGIGVGSRYSVPREMSLACDGLYIHAYKSCHAHARHTCTFQSG
jgi:hypothetical protein